MTVELSEEILLETNESPKQLNSWETLLPKVDASLTLTSASRFNSLDECDFKLKHAPRK